MGFQTGIFVPPLTGGIPPGPPTQVRLGNTLIVSGVGNDLNGARQDVVYHFATITAAIAAYQPDDLIVVYPGVYEESLSFSEDCRIHLMSGVTLTSDSVVLFITNDADVVITGDGLIVATGSGTGVALLSGTLFLECDSAVCEDQVALGLSDGESTIIIKDKCVTNGNGTAININGGVHFLYLNYCGDLIEDDSRTTDNGYFNAAIYVSASTTSEAYIHAKKVRIRATGITVVNNGARVFNLTADSIANDFALVLEISLRVAVISSNFYNDNVSVIRANLYAVASVAGYVCSDDGGNPQQNESAKHYFYGNISAEWGPAIWACGQHNGALFLIGTFFNVSFDSSVVIIGVLDTQVQRENLTVHVIGRVEARGDSVPAVFQYVVPGTTNDIKLVIDAIIVCLDPSVFSVATDSAPPQDVRIYRLISNVSSDPTTVNEIISLSVVDPLVI